MMAEERDELFEAQRREAMERRKTSTFRNLGFHLADPMNFPVFVSSLKKGKRSSRLREETGVGDAMNELAPYSEYPHTIALGAMSASTENDKTTPRFMRFLDMLRRKVSMVALKRLKGAREVSEKDGANVDRESSGVAR